MKENKITQLNDIQHCLLRPNQYIGAVVPTKCSTFVLNKDSEKFEYKEITYNPGFLKIIYEIIDNSVDEAIRTNFKHGDKIEVNIEKNVITVIDNGRGIPLDNADGSDISQLELALTSLRAGSNFNDAEGRTLLGMNGVGSSLTNIFSRIFGAVVYDKKRKGVLKCANNLSKKSCEIIPFKSKTSGTTIMFEPDYKRFGMKGIDQTHIDLIHQRLMFLSITYPEISFKLNNEVIKFKNNKNFMECFNSEYVVVQDKNKPSKYMIGVIPNEYDDFTHKSYINGADCVNGGNHIDYIHSEIVGRIKEKLSKKYPNIKVGDIKNRVSYIVNFREFLNPAFNSQTKENFSSNVSEIKEFLKDIDWDDFATKITKNKTIIDPIIESFKIKEELKNRDTLKKLGKNTKDFKCDKFLPATKEKKYFAICEGDCLYKDTLIKNYSTNTDETIKSIKIGDLVLTHEMNLKPILNKTSKLVDCIKIKTKSGKEIICSKQHKLFVYDSNKNIFCFKSYEEINKDTDKLISNKLTKFYLDCIGISHNLGDSMYALHIEGGHYQYDSSFNHTFMIFNKLTNSIEMVKAENLDEVNHLMILQD
jgi:DNA topoisomerase-2